ncbi:hypothetical protein A9Z06_07160 [Rhizobium sp. YK2]|nr:hypothetical protein A9Z06_07160 [Rhizobium sp. YK2]
MELVLVGRSIDRCFQNWKMDRKNRSFCRLVHQSSIRFQLPQMTGAARECSTKAGKAESQKEWLSLIQDFKDDLAQKTRLITGPDGSH